MKNSVFNKIAIILLSIFVVLVYYQIINHDIIDFDANMYLTSNSIVQSGLNLESIIWAFQSTLFNWHPVTWLSHMLDVELFGMNFGAHHFVSFILHLLNSILLFYLLLSFFSSIQKELQFNHALLISFFISLFFAVHPMNVQPVAWLAARKDLLAVFFGFLSLLLFFQYQTNNKKFYYILSLLAFALSLGSKASFVTLPFLLILFAYWNQERFRFSSLLNKIPFFLLSVGSVLITFYAQNQVGALRTLSEYSIFDRFVNVFVSYCLYLKKLFLPFELSIFYPFPLSFNFYLVVTAILVLLFFSILFFQHRHKYPALLNGWIWFLIVMLPMSGIVQLGDHAMADRYAYLPYIGLFISLTFSFYYLCRSNMKLMLPVLSMLAIYFAINSYQYVSVWKNSESIFKYSLKNTEDNYIIHNNLGTVYSRQERYHEALVQYLSTVNIEPSNIITYKNLGDTYLILEDYTKAEDSYQHYLKYQPQDYKAYSNLGIIYMIRKDNINAEKFFQKSIAINPDYDLARKNLRFLRNNSDEQSE